MFRLSGWKLALTAVSILAAGPALAQKSKDDLRIAAIDTYALLSPYDLPLDEASPVYEEIYSPLLALDEHTGKYVPELATSWTHPTPTSIEFELRQGVVLHSGKKFDADDIIAAINYTIDPATKIRSKNRYTWVKSVEKLGPYKIRVNTSDRAALDLYTFAHRFYVEDSEILAKLDSKEDYGRVSAASAGPYKLVSMDRNKGAVVERFDQLDPALKEHRRAPIKRIEILQIPDRQTQIAQLLTGGVDVLRNISDDTARDLATQPNIAITNTPSSQYVYMTLDAMGRSEHKELTDLRVRKAIVMAIDRNVIAHQVMPGGSAADVMDAICFPFTTACGYTTKPYAYDPDGAKKLLAEAGYPNGFELQLYAHAPVKDIAVAVAGFLQKVGIKATVTPLTINVYTQYREEGKLTAFIGSRPTANFPETTEIVDSFFTGSRDYYNDDLIKKALADGLNVADNDARAKVMTPALDRNNEQAYVTPLSSAPWVFAHTKDVRVDSNLLKVRSVFITDFFWK